VIRYQLSETPAFEAIRKTRQISKMLLLETLSQFRWETTLAVGPKITGVAWVGVLTVFAVSYLTKQLGMSQAFVLEAITFATVVELFAMPLAGWLSDRSRAWATEGAGCTIAGAAAGDVSGQRRAKKCAPLGHGARKCRCRNTICDPRATRRTCWVTPSGTPSSAIGARFVP
jgi:hypothetical protein